MSTALLPDAPAPEDRAPATINFRQAARSLGRPVATRTPTLGHLRDRWLADRRADGRRPRGVAAYADVFDRFVAFAGDVRADQITADLVKDYKRDLMGRVAAGTARHALTVVRSFCAWCVAEGYLDENVALRIAHPRVEAPDPDPLSRAQIGQLLAALDVPNVSHKATHARNRRAVCLMLYAGLRIAEAAGLERRDLDLDRRTLTVRREIAKGGKPRIVPICDELLAELEPVRAYRLAWAVIDQGDAPKRRGKPLEVKSVAHIFELWLPRRLAFPIHAHQLRKTFATELHLRGESLATIQRLLGHSDPKTTMRYIGSSAALEHAAVAKLQFRGPPDA